MGQPRIKPSIKKDPTMTGQDQGGKSPEKNQTEKSEVKSEKPAEHGGPKGPEPTRYQDWERGGRCVDF